MWSVKNIAGVYRTFSWVDRTAGVAVFFGTQVITDDIRYRRVLRNLVNSALMEKSCIKTRKVVKLKSLFVFCAI